VRRGFSLIELMVSVALLGVAIGSMGAAVATQQSSAASMVLRERALQLLEARADAYVRGVPLDPAAAQTLLGELPRGLLSERTEGGLRILTASWSEAAGKQTFELVLVERRR
jgi:prepilin-type N-terminal cleavage/methylation domain-containing protein